MEEEWRHVKGFMMYEISNHGRLRRARYMQVYKNGKFKIYEPYVHSETNAKGDYFRVILRGPSHSRRSCYIHRLVWEAFVGEIPKGYIVHHKDGNRQNNSLSNLQLVTAKEHHDIHLAEHPEMIEGMNRYNKFERPLTICQYSLDGKFIAEYRSGKEASDATGVCQRNILQVCNKTEYSKGRYRKQAGGYIWKFKNETIHN